MKQRILNFVKFHRQDNNKYMGFNFIKGFKVQGRKVMTKDILYVGEVKIQTIIKAAKVDTPAHKKIAQNRIFGI